MVRDRWHKVEQKKGEVTPPRDEEDPSKKRKVPPETFFKEEKRKQPEPNLRPPSPQMTSTSCRCTE
jgi:hypothetical protein